MVTSLTFGGVVAVSVLLVASAFFSASEIAIFSLERHRLGSLLERADPRADSLARLREDPHRLLVTILVGNNVVNVAIASVTTLVLAELLGPGVGLVAATLGTSALVLVFGEISPKSYGVANAESLSLRVARPRATLQRVLSPAVSFFDAVSRAITSVTGGEIEIEKPYVTREEISALLRSGEESGAIGEGERDMVEGVFDLSTTTAREVMVPRVDVVAVAADASLSEVVDVCADNRLTRVPVYEGTLDHVVGVADIRDVERAIREGATLASVLMDPIQVPDSREIDDLLTEMQARRAPMAVVRDEFGELEGILTVEDILEQIVGDIVEVGEERVIRPTDDGLLVRGEVTVGELNDVLEISLPTAGEYETIAGLINDELGRIGAEGDAVELAGVSLAVVGVEGNRIERVRVRHLPDADVGGETDEASPEADSTGEATAGVDGSEGPAGGRDDESTGDVGPTGRDGV